MTNKYLKIHNKKEDIKIIEKNKIKYINSGEYNLEIYYLRGTSEKIPFKDIKYLSIGYKTSNKYRKSMRKLLHANGIEVHIRGSKVDIKKLESWKKKQVPTKKLLIREHLKDPTKKIKIIEIRKSMKKIRKKKKKVETYKIPQDVQKIKNSTEIIFKPFTSKVLVHGLPGSGKTYIVIERIKHLLKTENLDPEREILILSFSRNAVREIKSRIINDKSLDVQSLNILTFDKFVAKLILNSSLEERYLFSSFDENIFKACELLQKKQLIAKDGEITHLLSNYPTIGKIRHIIIDEIQDVETVRAQFCVEIIDYCNNVNIVNNFGFTLLGDMNQEIFSYLADKSQFPTEISSSTEFIHWVKKKFDIEEFELNSDISVNPRFSNLPSRMKQKILTVKNLISAEKKLDSKKLKAILKEEKVSKLPIKNKKKLKDFLKHGKKEIAFLARKRYDAKKLSDLFFQNHISHKSLINKNGFIPAWLGYFLLQLRFIKKEDEDFIDKKDFLEKLTKNEELHNKLKIKNLWTYFGYLAYGRNEDFPSISFNSFIRNLVNNYDESMLSEFGNPSSNICITNIHKAKGREYNYVYLIKYFITKNMDVDQEIKVIYVALTRPKNDFYIFSLTNFKTNCPKRNGRYTSICYIKEKGKRKVNKFSFLKKKRKTCKERQNYIWENVKIGDHVIIKIEKIGDIIKQGIFHNGKMIGKYESWVVERIINWLDRRNLSLNQEFRDWITVKTTEKIEYSDKNNQIIDKIPPPYGLKGIWLGFETLGFLRRKCR